jgi:hypothetical protein
MGLGDSIRKAADNAAEDLAGLSEPADDGHVPEPDAAGEEIKVHSSISEGSNATAARAESRPGPGETRGQRQAGRGESGTTHNIIPGGIGSGADRSDGESSPTPEPGDGNGDVIHSVPGPAGLPDPDPDGLKADSSGADTDPSTGMGRG